MEIIQIQIRFAQNVGKVWIRKKKILPAAFHAISGHFACHAISGHFPWTEHNNKCNLLVKFLNIFSQIFLVNILKKCSPICAGQIPGNDVHP